MSKAESCDIAIIGAGPAGAVSAAILAEKGWLGTSWNKAWGGTGVSVDLAKGLHRVEVFQTAPGTGPYSSSAKDGGLMYLTWRAPSEKLKQVESRVVNGSEVVRSGECSLTAVEARDGSPVAAGIVKPGLTYWFENEEPLLIYNLSAVSTGQPAGTTWTWT